MQCRTKQKQCATNEPYMLSICQKSCQVCLDKEEILNGCEDGDDCDTTMNGDNCIDKDEDCTDAAFEGECVSNHKVMKENCMMSCGLCIPE